MKRCSFILAALAAIALVSCNGSAGEPALSGKRVDVTISIQGSPASSKAVNTTYADESKVNSLQVFVFDGDKLEDHKSVSSSMSVVVSATSGMRQIYAVVNAPDLYASLGGASMTPAGLSVAVSQLSDNAPDSFVMVGSTSHELEDGGMVPVVVRRIVSRVSIGKVSTNFKESRADYTVDLLGIYLINVAGDAGYVSGGASSWVNRLGHEDASYDALLCDKLTGVRVSNGSPYVQEHAFYPYPNPSGTSHDSQWSPRNTMLVLEVNLNKEDNEVVHGYYPIDLPALERNKTYIIEEVQLTRLPGNVPYAPIETGESTVTISVHEWELGLNLGNVVI